MIQVKRRKGRKGHNILAHFNFPYALIYSEI